MDLAELKYNFSFQKVIDFSKSIYQGKMFQNGISFQEYVHKTARSLFDKNESNDLVTASYFAFISHPRIAKSKESNLLNIKKQFGMNVAQIVLDLNTDVQTEETDKILKALTEVNTKLFSEIKKIRINETKSR